MNRRDASKMLGLGAFAVGAAAGAGLRPSGAAAATQQPVTAAPKGGSVSRANRKAWAKEHFRGFENVLMPSFTPDLHALDEAGIRLDVRKSIEHGFFSTLCAPVGLTVPEVKRFVEVAVDEAKGRISVALALPAAGSEAEALDLLAHAERAGCQHILLDLPSEGSEDDLYRFGAKYSEATNLGIYLWMAQKHNFRRFNSARIPYAAFDKLASLPNIVALKVGDMDPAVLFELFERYNDRMLIGALWLSIMPIAIKAYGEQWSGAWTVEALQSPEKPYATDFFKLMMAGKYEAGMKLYWRYLAPAFGAMMKTMGPLMPSGGHPWEHLKYYQFVSGGNGGRMRKDPEHPNLPPVTVQDMEGVKATFRSLDIVPSDTPDEAFRVGRLNYENGVRAKDLVG